MDQNPDTRCHSCGARVAAGAEWCTLCYASQRVDDRQEPQAQPAGQRPEPAGVVWPGGSLGAVGGGGAAAASPLRADSPFGPVDAAQAGALADAMLARLAAEAPRTPTLGPLSRSMSTAYGRAGIAALGVGAVMLGVFGLLALVGRLL